MTPEPASPAPFLCFERLTRRFALPFAAFVAASLPALANAPVSTRSARHQPGAEAAAPALPRNDGVNGGFADAGLRGQYFANDNFEGAPAFERRDVRIDFNWTGHSAGGSTEEPYASFPAEGFSVRWTGRLLPRFAGEYTISATSDDDMRVRIRAKGSADWENVIESRPKPEQSTLRETGQFHFATAGAPCDIEVQYRHRAGIDGRHKPAVVRLGWTGPGQAWEVIDPAQRIAVNVPEDGFTDAMKMSRGDWRLLADSGTPAARDEHGWPGADAACVIWSGASHKQGVYRLTFHGRADLSALPAGAARISGAEYDAGANLSRMTVAVGDAGASNLTLLFKDTRRTSAHQAGTGVTDIRLLSPTVAGGDGDYPAGSIFMLPYRTALARFDALRFATGTSESNAAEWQDRTPVDYATQRPVHSGESGVQGNGAAWEYRVMLANETGKDLYLTLPARSSDDYITRIANLVRYGSDGNDPYTEPTAKPVYPPLNSNLRVYVEFGTEIWDTEQAAGHQNFAAAQTAVNDGTAEGKLLTYDNSADPVVIAERRYALRTRQVSDLFRAVFGDAAIGERVRVVLQWPTGKDNMPSAAAAAAVELAFLDRNGGQGDDAPPNATVRTARSAIWGAGAPAFYGGERGDSVESAVPNGDFENPKVGETIAAPISSPWGFKGTAGVMRNGSSHGFGGPYAAGGDQAGYIQGAGSMTLSFTLPIKRNAPIYALRFKAVERRRPANLNCDNETFDVLIDGKPASQANDSAAAYRAGVSWASYDTATFSGEAGSTHTVTFVGRGTNGNLAAAAPDAVLIDDLQLTSVDAVFAKPLPEPGFAARIQSAANWARRDGLQFVSAEGGWSVGGIGETAPIERAAQALDPRTVSASENAIAIFDRAAGATAGLDTLGPDAPWASVETAATEPLPRSVDAANGGLRAEATGETPLPGDLTPANQTTDYGLQRTDTDKAGALATDHWMAWNVRANETGPYRLVVAANGGAARLTVDGVVTPLQSTAAADGSPLLVAPVLNLTAGSHTIVLKATGPEAATVTGVRVEPAAPVTPQG